MCAVRCLWSQQEHCNLLLPLVINAAPQADPLLPHWLLFICIIRRSILTRWTNHFIYSVMWEWAGGRVWGAEGRWLAYAPWIVTYTWLYMEMIKRGIYILHMQGHTAAGKWWPPVKLKQSKQTSKQHKRVSLSELRHLVQKRSETYIHRASQICSMYLYFNNSKNPGRKSCPSLLIRIRFHFGSLCLRYRFNEQPGYGG